MLYSIALFNLDLGLILTYLRQCSTVFILYTLSGWVGINFANMGEGSLTLIWLPSGIALASCIIFGKSILPAIWLGSFIANTPYLIEAPTDNSTLFAIFIGAIAALINTSIQAYLAFFLYQKHIKTQVLESSRLILNFILKVIAPASMLNIALLLSVYTLAGYTSLSSNSGFFNIIQIWFSGALADIHGYFVVTPFILNWYAHRSPIRIISKQWFCLGLLSFISLTLVSIALVDSAIFLLLALGVLITLYSNMRIATAYVLTISLIFSFVTAKGLGPFHFEANEVSFISLIMFILSLGLSIYLLAAKRYEIISAYAKLEEKVKERTKKLNLVNKQLKNISQTDGLTGIPNRRCFDEFILQEWQRAIRNQSPISLLMIDIDYFKQYNDLYGHVQGDDTLIKIAQEIHQQIHRPGDLLARYGGEEFAIVLPETTDAESIAELIRTKILELEITHQGSTCHKNVTISIGCSTFYPQKGSPVTDIIQLSDKALYQAKNDGRNNIKVYNSTLVDLEGKRNNQG